MGLRWIGVIPLLRRNGAMLPWLLVWLLMLRRDRVYIRFILSLALVSLSMADETFKGLYDARTGWHGEERWGKRKREMRRLGGEEERR